MRHLFSRSISSLAVCLALSSFSVARAEDNITLNFVNADIPSVVKAISGHTGKNFILDPRVTGNINIISQTPVSKDVAYQMLLTALRVGGFAAIEERGSVKIVPEAEAKTSGTVIDRGTQLSGDRIVTQTFVLQNESAAQLATVLRPLVAPNNFIGAYPGNNTLVITDYAENVKRIAKIIAAIDVPTSSDLQFLKLQYASAVDVANLLKGLMPEMNPNPANPGAPAKLSVGVEPRTNSLLVRADTPALVNRIRNLLAGIDVPTAANGNIHVVYLRNAEASKMADTLRGLMSGAASTSGTASASSSTITASNSPTGAGFGASAQTAGTGATVSSSAPSGATSGQVSSTIQAYPATNSLVIIAPDHVYNSLRTVIDKLDQRRAQVNVEALIVEVNDTIASELGVQWQDLSGLNRANAGAQVIGGTNFGTTGNIISSAANLATVGEGLNIGIVRGRINIPGIGEVIGLGALAKALQTDQRTNVLSTPNVMTLDNEEGKIVVGQNVPFVTGSFTTGTTGSTNPFQTIERRDIGLTLRVTPQVTEGGTVKLKTFLEVSSVVPTTTSVRSADLITNKRSIESTVLVDNDEIFVIGGLIQDDTRNGESKVPFLGDIPYLGNLFKTQNKSRGKTNLMVFLRPIVMRDSNAARKLSADRYEYIKNEQAVVNARGATFMPPKETSTLPNLAPVPNLVPTLAPTPAPSTQPLSISPVVTPPSATPPKPAGQ